MSTVKQQQRSKRRSNSGYGYYYYYRSFAMSICNVDPEVEVVHGNTITRKPNNKGNTTTTTITDSSMKQQSTKKKKKKKKKNNSDASSSNKIAIVGDNINSSEVCDGRGVMVQKLETQTSTTTTTTKNISALDLSGESSDSKQRFHQQKILDESNKKEEEEDLMEEEVKIIRRGSNYDAGDRRIIRRLLLYDCSDHLTSTTSCSSQTSVPTSDFNSPGSSSISPSDQKKENIEKKEIRPNLVLLHKLVGLEDVPLRSSSSAPLFNPVRVRLEGTKRRIGNPRKPEFDLNSLLPKATRRLLGETTSVQEDGNELDGIKRKKKLNELIDVVKLKLFLLDRNGDHHSDNIVIMKPAVRYESCHKSRVQFVVGNKVEGLTSDQLVVVKTTSAAAAANKTNNSQQEDNMQHHHIWKSEHDEDPEIMSSSHHHVNQGYNSARNIPSSEEDSLSESTSLTTLEQEKEEEQLVYQEIRSKGKNSREQETEADHYPNETRSTLSDGGVTYSRIEASQKWCCMEIAQLKALLLSSSSFTHRLKVLFNLHPEERQLIQLTADSQRMNPAAKFDALLLDYAIELIETLIHNSSHHHHHQYYSNRTSLRLNLDMNNNCCRTSSSLNQLLDRVCEYIHSYFFRYDHSLECCNSCSNTHHLLLAHTDLAECSIGRTWDAGWTSSTGTGSSNVGTHCPTSSMHEVDKIVGEVDWLVLDDLIDEMLDDFKAI